ncbi:CotH kinase family protein [Solibacillus silvestris]|uniref:CotH kinase family protein n=1 Tax=Solibacillus silvestris TaxID=76853 RepID=UPI003F7D86AD
MVDARPLLNIVLEDEETRALYDSYLEKIATEILTEENVSAITTKLHDLLLNAVDEDPTKFATTEQFTAGASGEQSLPEFAKQRSESILKQLAGEIEGVSAASSSSFDNMNGEMPNSENTPQMNGQTPPNFGNGKETGVNGGQGAKGTPPQMNGQAPPNFGNGEETEANGGQGAQGTPPQMNGEMPQMGGFPGQQGSDQSTTINSKQTLILLAASFAVVFIAIGAVVLLSRKKYKKG